MTRQLIGWTAGICMLIAFALGGSGAHGSAYRRDRQRRGHSPSRHHCHSFVARLV